MSDSCPLARRTAGRTCPFRAGIAAPTRSVRQDVARGLLHHDVLEMARGQVVTRGLVLTRFQRKFCLGVVPLFVLLGMWMLSLRTAHDLRSEALVAASVLAVVSAGLDLLLGGSIGFLVVGIAFFAFLTGWGLAPDLMKEERRYWTLAGLRDSVVERENDAS